MWELLKKIFGYAVAPDETPVAVRVRDVNLNELYMEVEIEDEIVRVPAPYEELERILRSYNFPPLVLVHYHKVNGEIRARF